MEFITGGAYSGKTEYAKKNYIIKHYVNSKTELDTLLKEEASEDRGCVFVDCVELIVRELCLVGEDAAAYFAQASENRQEWVFAQRELGCGVVPMDAFERSYREVNGRVACILAGKSGRVIRMVAGRGQIIKDYE